MDDFYDFLKGPEGLEDMSADGGWIIGQLRLMSIEPRRTVVYHVGLLPRDIDYQFVPLPAFRAGDVCPNEIASIVQFAETIARYGKCRLDTYRVTDDVVVYYAVGI